MKRPEWRVLTRWGFYDTPFYHGTSAPEEFRAFDLSKAGNTTGASAAKAGVWFARDPAVADEFARWGSAEIDRPRILPLMYRSDRRASLHLDGTEKNHEIAATLDHAWDRGYDSVMLRNYTSPGGSSGKIFCLSKTQPIFYRPC